MILPSDTGSQLSRRLGLLHEHKEKLVRSVVEEFEIDALPRPATSQFLANEAAPLLDRLIKQAVTSAYREHFDRIEVRSRVEAHQAVRAMVVQLQQVAWAEIRALRASEKFARPVSSWKRRLALVGAAGTVATALGAIIELGKGAPLAPIIKFINELLTR